MNGKIGYSIIFLSYPQLGPQHLPRAGIQRIHVPEGGYDLRKRELKSVRFESVKFIYKSYFTISERHRGSFKRGNAVL